MRRVLTGALFTALLISGCQADPFTDVSGTVSLDGKPIADGEVIFLAADQSATPSAGRITDGQFRFRATYGAKTVQINATRDTGRREMDGWPIRESIIPERYNSKSTLTAEVKHGGPNHFPFELTSRR